MRHSSTSDVDDPSAMYLAKANIAMIWPYDDDGRLLGEDVWEYDDTDRDVTKLDPADVITVEQSAKLLEALIKPLRPLRLLSDRIRARAASARDWGDRGVSNPRPPGPQPGALAN